ncbi:MAG: hypothetical protein GY851_04790, partial [bacterium]|nr:hypothetical protein [bacterium]
IWDAMFEFWRNSILSGIQTNVVNLTSNLGKTGITLGPERLSEALVNLGIRNPNAAQLGEFKHMLRGFMPGLLRGIHNAHVSIQTGRPYFEESIGREAHTKLERGHGAQIAGVKGEAVRIPQTTLQAMDELFKTWNAEIDIGAQAYRIAKMEKLKGQKMAQRMTELMMDTDSLAWDRAMDTALENTFQEHPEGG